MSSEGPGQPSPPWAQAENSRLGSPAPSSLSDILLATAAPKWSAPTPAGIRQRFSTIIVSDSEIVSPGRGGRLPPGVQAGGAAGPGSGRGRPPSWALPSWPQLQL